MLCLQAAGRQTYKSYDTILVTSQKIAQSPRSQLLAKSLKSQEMLHKNSPRDLNSFGNMPIKFKSIPPLVYCSNTFNSPFATGISPSLQINYPTGVDTVELTLLSQVDFFTLVK